MIANRIVDDLHEQRARVLDLIDASKRLQGVKSNFLSEIFIVKRRAGALCGPERRNDQPPTGAERA